MSKKIITAREILEQKTSNLAQTKFDTNGFVNEIGRFFLKHEVWDTLTVKPVIFARHKEVIAAHNITGGWLYIKTPYECDKYASIFNFGKDEDWNKAHAFFHDFSHEMMHVDSAFVKNAIATLQVIAGYVVKYNKKDNTYTVSLQ